MIETLCTLLVQDNDLTRCWAVRALGRIGATTAVAALIERLTEDPDPDVRMEAAAALGTLACQESTAALIEVLHHDPDGEVRIQACLALGKIGNDRAREALRAALSADEPFEADEWAAEDDAEFDATWEIQHRALEILGELGDGRAVADIVRLMQDETYEDLQELGFRVLARLGGGPAREFLLQQLQNGHPRVRCRAARALAQLPAPEVVRGLMQALRDREPEVCIAAAWALAEHRDPDIVPALLRLLRHLHDEVRREAAAVVATLEGEEANLHLRRLLHDRKRAVQRQAVRLVGKRQDGKAVKILLDLLDSAQQDAAFGHDIIQALGAIGAPEATLPLCRLYHNERLEAETRLQLVLALGHTARHQAAGTEGPDDRLDAVTVLIGAVGDADEKVAVAALASLARIGGARASEVLAQVLRGDAPRVGQPPDRDDADAASTPAFPTSTLAAMQAESAVAGSHDEAAERRRRMRRHAARMARDLADPAAVETLLQAVDDADADLRREALISLGHIGDPRGTAAAVRHLTSESREVQLAAIETLQRLRPAESLPPLLHLLQEATDAFVLQQTIDALGRCGDQGATGPIVQRLHHANLQVRRAALEALATIGDGGVIDAIRPCIFAHSGELRTEATAALKTLGDPSLTDFLLETLTNPTHEEHHWIAIEALAELYQTA